MDSSQAWTCTSTLHPASCLDITLGLRKKLRSQSQSWILKPRPWTYTLISPQHFQPPGGAAAWAEPCSNFPKTLPTTRGAAVCAERAVVWAKPTQIHCKSNANLLQIHCKSIANPLQIHCSSISDPLQIQRKSIANPLQIHLKSITNPTQAHCKSIADPSHFHPRFGGGWKGVGGWGGGDGEEGSRVFF